MSADQVGQGIEILGRFLHQQQVRPFRLDQVDDDITRWRRRGAAGSS
jgi:hypothetical protein